MFKAYSPTWCGGCGNWSVYAAVQKAIVARGLKPHQVTVCFGIGCSGNANDFLPAYSIHALHGRAIANAIGIKLANHKQQVLVLAGDGDTYGEGGNHFLHACRANHDVTLFVHDNNLYGLTTGQVSPTARVGTVSKSTAQGQIDRPLDPLALAISQGATFVAQAFAGRLPQLTELMEQALKHRGFALLNILQPCVTFGKAINYQYYLKRLVELPVNYQADDPLTAYEYLKTKQAADQYPVGVLYRAKGQPTYIDSVAELATRTLLGRPRFKNAVSLLDQFS